MDESLLRHLEQLAGLQLSADEIARFAADLARILTYVRQLDDVDTAITEPRAELDATDCPRRSDTPSASLTADEVLAAAPDRAGSFFVVSGVLPVFDDGDGDE